MLKVKQTISQIRNRSLVRNERQASFIKASLDYQKQYFGVIQQILSKKHKSEQDYHALQQFFINNGISYVSQLRSQISSQQQFRNFMDKLKLAYHQQGQRLVEKGRKIKRLAIILQGRVSFNDQKQISTENKTEATKICESKSGELIGPSTFQSGKHSPYLILCETVCVFLEFDEQTFNRFVRKSYLKQQQNIVHILSQSSLFKSVGLITLRKHLPFFFLKKYKHDQILFSEGQTQNAIQIILDGEVDIKKRIGDETIKVVRLGQKQFFGIQKDTKFQNAHQYSAEVSSCTLSTIYIQGKIFIKILNDNPVIAQNLQAHLQKIEKFHGLLLKRNQSIMQNQNNIINLINKKKKKRKKHQKFNVSASLQWWGLAGNYVRSRRYRIPQKPVSHQSSVRKVQSNLGFQAQRINFAKKIDHFRKRVFESQMNLFSDELERLSDKQNDDKSHFKSTYVPKMKKIRIQMIDTKPRAIDMTQKTKKKLVGYAKNSSNFCDRLNLQ